MKTSDPADFFHQFCTACAHVVGTSWTFVLALAVIVLWAVTGPLFDYSDTWQLLINTGTTIVTFLMVFLIQNAQNRDAEATQLKLDELIRAVKGARKSMLDVEDLSDDELTRLKEQFARMGDHPDDPVRRHLKKSLGSGRRHERVPEDAGGEQSRQGTQDKPIQAGTQPSSSTTPPRPRQRQFEEYTQPLRVSQRQWS
ncbi:low affinity iron permease family protein [Herbaspirillum sp. LeCh32-8]|uniref:low affinity iron permease family protein n=1 Tax=Herbaspirillum sp. LeCh32-8 TaxID=2821356 RepID=UPI001AE6BCA1|nr:low affinity iron permease family protein [Herbaspirillum sp. LeCh32-8]MBP0598129.1 low affinity iron permease family protein [Herbaspirillum sp. LeCh32-8]